MQLPGVRFEATEFTPRTIPGMISKPRFEGRLVRGVRLIVTDARAYQPLETGVHVLEAMDGEAKAAGRKLVSKPDWLAKLMGTRRLHELYVKGAGAGALIAAWQRDVTEFRAMRAKYLLY